MITNLTLILFAYLIGSLASAVIVSKFMGLPDPRTEGSRNPGATNVLRLGNRRAAVIALLGDMLKGFIPVTLAYALEVSSATLAGVGLAAFFGHLYPVFFGFRGGKGVATSLGVLLGLSWPVGLACLATWLITALVSRFSSLAALCAAFMAPLYMHWVGVPAELQIATLIMTTLLIWRHRANIHNLINGTESKIGVRG
ncbi:MAG TPA: glycerol-3-phosphate 1-O-acyltransferase PlsY [Gammaproteobacteria bacterium]|nr:glycerol-3-phosphate 1-O-acyltransferase PlsY [Gammaproteobacteria bacterium]